MWGRFCFYWGASSVGCCECARQLGFAFAILHKMTCTDLWEKRHGHMRFMEFQTFLLRLGDDSLTNWAWAFETEGMLKKL